MDRRTRAYLSPCLADAFLAGPWDAAALATRAGLVLEPRPPWIGLLVRNVLAAYERRPADRPRELAAYIALQLEQIGAPTAAPAPRVRRWLGAELAMGRRPWPVPELASLGAVASHLGVSDGHLAWLADVRGLERTVADEKLRHYRYAWLPRHGGPPRVIERPKARLKSIQRRVLHGRWSTSPSRTPRRALASRPRRSRSRSRRPPWWARA